MSRIWQFREFDTIVAKDTIAKKNDKQIGDLTDGSLSSAKNYKYIDHKSFELFVNYIKSCALSPKEGDYNEIEETVIKLNSDYSNILEFFDLRSKPGVGDTLTIRNYVGLIQLSNGDKIEILPKIDFFDSRSDRGTVSEEQNLKKKDNVENSQIDDSDKETLTKNIFIKMLSTLLNFNNKNFSNSHLNTAKMSIFEIFINMYLNAVQTIVKKGIKSAYLPVEENLNFCKGKILIEQQIRKNLVHSERFYVCYDEYLVNRPINKIIKATLLKFFKLSTSSKNLKLIRDLLISFDSVDASTNYEEDFAKMKLDRSTKDYDLVIKWSKVFLHNKSLTTFSGNTFGKALLFPMERIFESYVATIMKKLFPNPVWDVSAQDCGKYLFNMPQNIFALRPDIVVKNNETKTTYVIDTKWKRLIPNPQKNFGISQADMYQMYAYSKKYSDLDKVPFVCVIYPMTTEMYEYKIFKSDDGTRVGIFFVDLSQAELSLSTLFDWIEKIS